MKNGFIAAYFGQDILEKDIFNLNEAFLVKER